MGAQSSFIHAAVGKHTHVHTKILHTYVVSLVHMHCNNHCQCSDHDDLKINPKLKFHDDKQNNEWLKIIKHS